MTLWDNVVLQFAQMHLQRCMFKKSHFFFDNYGLTKRDLEHFLAAALERGGDYADLYFEYLSSTSLMVDESVVKSGSQGVSAGCGVRVLNGTRVGYSYTDDLSSDRILRAARTAALIANGNSGATTVRFRKSHSHNLYPAIAPSANFGLTDVLAIVMRADRAAREYHPHVNAVRVSYAEELRNILVVASDGTLSEDSQPLARLNVSCIAESGFRSARGVSGGGGRVSLDFFRGTKPEQFAQKAARAAVEGLKAREAPVGEMDVVLAPGWAGTLFHDAIGHCLEADFIHRRVSVFTGSIGKKVASPGWTLVDNGRIPGLRGSVNVDDEGYPTQETVLIENGILKNCLTDKLRSRLMRIPNTGNGRRESYEHPPMPRMTNTYVLQGTEDPVDIIRSVKKGIYVANAGGGHSDIANGRFYVSVSEAYLIENGRKTEHPITAVQLTGFGPDLLNRVSLVGADHEFDAGVGTCGKDGQAIPVGVGNPTIKLEGITVGNSTMRGVWKSVVPVPVCGPGSPR